MVGRAAREGRGSPRHTLPEAHADRGVTVPEASQAVPAPAGPSPADPTPGRRLTLAVPTGP